MAATKRRASDDENSDGYLHRNAGWRVQKEISIPTLVVLCVQSAGAIWWAASMQGRVDTLEKSLLAMQNAQVVVDNRQDADAIRVETRISLTLDRMSAKIDRLIESRLGQ